MDRQDRHRFVQQYVERQKAYLPTYTAEGLVDECHGTPSRRDAEFGFDTPVLRPRVPAKPQPTALQAGPGKPRTHKAELSKQGTGEAPSRDSAPGQKDKPRNKRKKAPTPNDTDNERAARLADRRERKRKKRAIVNPPKEDDDKIVSTTAPKKGRLKKPTGLALLYGFSATNVTKGRLTLKPMPSLGVFSKGKASAKKKVAATKKSCEYPVAVVKSAALKNSASRHELFSESAFLNRPSERAGDPLETDEGSNDSSTSNHPTAQETRVTNRTTKDRGKCTELKTSQASSRTRTESEVWDIEMQSKLPSSAREVSSEPEAKESAPVVLDLRGAEWSASLNEAYEKRRNKTQTASSSVAQSRSRGHSVACSSPRAGSELCDFHAVDVSSLHPCHSASQVGRAGDTQASDLRLVTSTYFTEPMPVSDQEFAINRPQTPRSSDDIDLQDQDVVLDVETIHRAASPVSSLTSVPLRTAEFQTRYDMDRHEFRSDSCPYDECRGGMNVAWEPLGGLDRGYFDSPSDRSMRAAEYDCDMWNWYPSAGLATDDVEIEGSYDPLVREYEDDLEPVVEPCFFEGWGEHDAEEGYCIGECGRESAVYEGECVDGSIGYSEESLGEAADFLEGRALLLGVHEERARCEGVSGLVEAEMDVASRLRGHWRPLRL